MAVSVGGANTWLGVLSLTWERRNIRSHMDEAREVEVFFFSLDFIKQLETLKT